MNTPSADSLQNLPLDNLLAFRAAKSAREMGREADQQNQAKPAADDRTTKVKSTTAE